MVIKCNEEFQASGEIFWGSVAFSEHLILAAELTSYHPGLDECMRNSLNFQLLKILWWGHSGISRALEVFLESWTNVPCPLESDCGVEVPNLGNGSAGWGRSMRGLAHDPCIWSTCLGILVHLLGVLTAPAGWAWEELYPFIRPLVLAMEGHCWRRPGLCLRDHCELRAAFSSTERYMSFLLKDISREQVPLPESV